MKLFRASVLLASLTVTLLNAAPGDLDPTFISGIGAGITPNSYPTFDGGTGAVNAVALQATGKIIAGGNVSKFNNTGALSALKRLNADGTLDTTFNSAGAGLAASSGQPEVNALLVAPDDKIYVGGTFSTYNGEARSGFARLNDNGTLDASFATSGVTGPARYVAAIALQADGKVIAAGAFSAMNGVSRPSVARLNTNGTLDTSFAPANYVANGGLRAVAVAPDGKIYIGGLNYNAAKGQNDPILIRLNTDGSRDFSFSPIWGTTYGAINAIVILPDGRIAIGGDIPLPGYTAPMAVFNASGTLDTAFMSNFNGSYNGGALTLSLAPEGRLIAGGIFTEFGGKRRASVARINLDGTHDLTFAPEPYAERNGNYITHIYSIAVQTDGRLVAGGWFNHVTNPALDTYNLTRFEGDYTAGPGTISLTSPGFIVNENAGPGIISVARFGGINGSVSVDYSVSASTATADDFTPVSGTLTWAANEGGIKTITVPITNDALVESLEAAIVTLSNPTGGATLGTALGALGIRDDDSPPNILIHPIAATIDQGGAYTFVIAYDSVLAATVQWQFDSGSGFADIPGATGIAYSVTSADRALHHGSYRAVITNANGAVTSNAANLTVLIPAGSLVNAFNPTSSLTYYLSSGLDPAGNILAAGINGIVRISTAGVVDTTFTPAFNGAVNSLIPLPDGSMFAAGTFTTVTGTARNYFAHINADGTLDTAANLSLTQAVNTIALGASNKLYVGHAGAQGLKRYTLSGANGTLDASFTTLTLSGTSAIHKVKERTDGKIFVAYTTSSSSYNFRLLTNAGAADASFTPPTIAGGAITDWDILPDGRIVVVGSFGSINGTTSRGIAVLNANGSLDTSLDFSTAFVYNPSGVRFLNGRLLVWGQFNTYKGTAIAGIARINLDGTLDTTFKVGAGVTNLNSVVTVTVLNDQRLFLGGNFINFRGVARNRLALLEAGPTVVSVATGTYSVVENTGNLVVTVRRFAPAPGAVSIDYSTANGSALAGTDYTATSGTLSWAAGDVTDRTVTIPILNDSIGETLKTFQFSLNSASITGEAGLSIASATVTITDDDNPPVIVTPPASQTVNQGIAATFTVVATSTPAATYRWTFNGVDLNDGSGISGATTSTLSIASAGPTHIGAYRVRLTNTNGVTTSDPAQLSVNLNPAFIDHTWSTSVTLTGSVYIILPLPDGGAYVGGVFTNFNGQNTRNYLVKIDASGVIDPTFSPAPNGGVRDLRLVDNVLYVLAEVSNSFAQIGGGAAVSGFAAIDATTGARIAPFMTNLGVGATAFTSVRALAVAPDGDIVLGGDFTSFNNNPNHRYLARINADGTLDANWNTSQATPTSGTALVVTAVDVGPDNKVVAGGTITHQGGSRLIRFNTDGTRDSTFVPEVNVGSTSVSRIKVLADGRVLATGNTLPGGRTIVRLSTTGTWSSTDYFGTTGGTFYDAAMQRNGRTIGVGTFNFVRQPAGSGSVSNIARFDTTGNYEATWATGVGFSGDARTVAIADDGKIWVGGDFNLYNGTAVSKIVRLNGDVIPLGITLQPKSLNVNPAATAVFKARATGTTAITYQWRKDGTPLVNGGNISGADTAELTIANTAETDEGIYTLRITNASGEEISANATLAVLGAPEILTQPASNVTTFGNRAYSLEVSVRGVAPLTFKWQRDGADLVEGANGITGTTTTRLSFTNIALTDAGVYTLVITNANGSVTSTPITLAVNPHPSDRATTFASLSGTNPTTVNTILPLPDGGALIGGRFNSIVGANSTVSGARLARVLPNGEMGALPFTLNDDVYALHRQPDGKILVSGAFTLVTPTSQSAVTRNRLIRLNADFTFDPSFDVGAGMIGTTIRGLKTDTEGRIYVGGDFTGWTGHAGTAYVARLTRNGVIDPTFSAVLNNYVLDIELDAAGRVYVAGQFTNYQGSGYLVRLLEDGTRDTAFTQTNFSSLINDIVVQPDGKVLLTTNVGVRRLLETGALDATFAATSASTNNLSLQSDGKILAGGSFTSYNGFVRGGLVRLLPDGTVDPVLEIATNSASVNVVRTDAYGRIWVGGIFTTFNNVTARSIAVLNGDVVPLGFVAAPGPVSVEAGQTAALTATATGSSTITYRWFKNGVALNDGGRISGTTTATLTITGTQISDRDFYTVKITNASGMLESPAAELAVLAAPEILIAPPALTREVGQSVSLTVDARGAGTLTYQWLKSGTPLTNGGNISGATSATLTLTSLALTDAGGYSVRVTGSAGNTTTTPAVLTVNLNPAGVNRSVTLPTFNNAIYTLLPNDDGTFFAGGQFTTVTWSGGGSTRNYFAKINANGSPDATWPVFNNVTYAIAKDSSGRVYVGGAFTTVTPSGSSAVTRNRLVRLNANGTLDTTFNAPGGVAGAGPNSNVKGIKIDPSGRVYIFGEFSQYNGTAANYVARLNEDGTRDTAFVSPTTSFVYDVEFTNDGRLWIGHGGNWSGQFYVVLTDGTGAKDPAFSYTGNMMASGIGLLPDNTALSFSGNYPYIQKVGLTGAVTTLTAIPNNQLTKHAQGGSQFYIHGPSVTTFDGATTGNLIRVNANGSRDATFAGGAGFNGTVETMVVDSQGRLWVGGSFISYNGDTTITRLVVLNGGEAQTNSGPPADPFVNYLTTAGVPEGQRGPNDDPDGDGVSNLLEYALGLNAALADPQAMPAPTVVNNRLTYIYERARTDLTYSVETSTDLQTWTITGVDQGTPDTEGVTIASVAMDVPNRFMRLKVTRP